MIKQLPFTAFARLRFQSGGIQSLGEEVKALGGKKVFLVTDPGQEFRSCGPGRQTPAKGRNPLRGIRRGGAQSKLPGRRKRDRPAQAEWM